MGAKESMYTDHEKHCFHLSLDSFVDDLLSHDSKKKKQQQQHRKKLHTVETTN
jgi:hypothetical protein